MFFDRTGAKAQSSSSPRPTRQRNWAALGLAAAMALPAGISNFNSRADAGEAGQDRQPQTASTTSLIAQGQSQFDQQKYEEAELTLGAVQTAGLDGKARDGYLALLTQVKNAATERRIARQELRDGNDAMAAQQKLEALGHYESAASNHYADAKTVAAARARLAAIEWPGAGPRAAAPAVTAIPAVPLTPKAAAGATLTGKQYYDLGLSQYRQGDWTHARQSLQMALDASYQPASIYEDSPAEILKRISRREQNDRQRVLRLADTPTTGEAVVTEKLDPLAALKATDEARQIRHQQAVAQAQEWVKEGQDAKNGNNYDRALDLFTRAANLDPNNAAAVQGRDQVLTLLGRNPSPPDLGNRESADLRAERGEIQYKVQSNLDQARAATAQGQFGQAQIAIDRARLGAAADPTIFKQQDLRQMQTQIDQADLDLRQAEEHAQGLERRDIDQKIQSRIDEQRHAAMLQRQRTIADLIHTAQQLTNQGRYNEALQTVEQILILDPINDYAVGVRPLLEDKTQFAEQRDFTELRDRKVASMLNAAEEKLVPYDDILRYPVDWPDISATRDQTIASERGGNTTDRAVQAQLDRQLPELQFDAVGFSDVVDFLRDVSGSNIFVNWKSLEAAGVDRNTPVTARLHNIKFSKALGVILDSVGGGQTKLAYTVDQGVITISTADDLSKNVVVTVYDIRDLIINVPDFTDAPEFSLTSTSNGGGGGGGGVGQGGGGAAQQTNTLFSGTGNTAATSTGPTREELVESITKLIEDTVATDSWKDNGGSVGALRELQGQLIVTQTPENHRQLVNLLEQLRETRAIQVTIEARFLTVQRNFLEDVGVDLNFLFNLNGSWSKNFGTIPVTSPNSTFVQNPTTGVQGSIGSLVSTPTGLTTSATYLDDFQVQLTLRAVEASVNSTLVTAPRITLFNGQRAYVLVAIQRAYVSNLTPVVSTGISSFSPTISIVESGVLLDVQATVSADRKYVTLTLRPELATLLDLANFTFQQGSSATGGGFGVGGGFVGGFAAAEAPSGTIQEPELQITEVKTTVSVPDGGTLLLGGQTVAGETEREIGVPVLSKIPFLKRLFTNRSMAKDEQILLILVRPTIILQREIEQKQFPLLTSKVSG